MTTDPSVPAAIRDNYSKLGLCKDEFASYDHFSPALYVRESRRMKGLYVITQNDILESPKKDDPIAISSFPIDSHDCQRIALEGGGVINEGTIFPVRNQKLRQGYAYHVPYRSILPKPDQCDNLLVPVALSCTHVGISSLRIEGAWMVIGQAAGIAAALAARSGRRGARAEVRKTSSSTAAAKSGAGLAASAGAAVRRIFGRLDPCDVAEGIHKYAARRIVSNTPLRRCSHTHERTTWLVRSSKLYSDGECCWRQSRKPGFWESILDWSDWWADCWGTGESVFLCDAHHGWRCYWRRCVWQARRNAR